MPTSLDYFKKQRDLYKYIHDQSVRLMNMGYTGEEISEQITLPPELNDFWPNRGYYGTLRHNSRAIYQRYMGWYSGNPSDLDNLPPEMVGPKYIEFMGGEQEVLKKAKASFDKGEYRWVAEVLKHLVFANPNNTEGKLLLADALEQLGYQAESGPWRSVYLQGAYELRNGVPNVGGTVTASPDTIRAMSPSMLFDYLSVRINPEKAAGKKMVINMAFTDIGEKHTLSLENSVLNHTTRYATKPDVTITLSKRTLDDIQLGQGTMEQKIANGEIKIEGDQQTFSDFVTPARQVQLLVQHSDAMMQRTLRACMVLLCFIPGMGQSCGYDALYPNPFEQSWPGTVNIAMATATAVSREQLPPLAALTGEAGFSRSQAWLQTLKSRLQQAGVGGGISILLIDSGLWSRVRGKESLLLQLHTSGPNPKDRVMLLSEAAINAMLNGSLTIEQGLQLGIVELQRDDNQQLQRDLHKALSSQT